MKAPFLSLVAATVMAVSTPAQQQPPPPYQTVTCVKLNSGKTSKEYRQFVNETTLKMAQTRADAGEIISWSLLRSAMPAGAEARCDFMIATTSEAPPRALTEELLAASLERARIRMTAPEFLARRDSLVRLINTELWRPLIRVGQPQKGNYLFLNYMKVQNAAEYRKFENEIWKPMAEQWIKDGAMTGWLFAVKQLPGGTDVKYAAMSADIFANSDAAFKGFAAPPMFAKIHPGQNYQETMERLGKLRSLAERQLLVIEERVAKK